MQKRRRIAIFLFCCLGLSLLPGPLGHEENSQKTLFSAALSILSPQALAKSTTVYITNTGTKYHVSSCRHLRRSKKAITISKAKAQGYQPCKVCKPPR